MAFSLTGAVYLFGFFALALLSFRLFQYRKREETTVSRLLFYFAGLLDLFFFVTALGSLFFAQNQEVLKGVVIIAAFLQGLAAAILGYLIVYLKIPRISPWFGFSAISVLALAAIAFTVVTPFFPRLDRKDFFSRHQYLAYFILQSELGDRFENTGLDLVLESCICMDYVPVHRHN